MGETSYVEHFVAEWRDTGGSELANSRSVRRSVQSDRPLRVIDASIADVQAAVVHSHEQPTSHASLACIYHHVPNDQIREQAIADGLGIGLGVVKESLISPAAAQRIAEVSRAGGCRRSGGN